MVQQSTPDRSTLKGHYTGWIENVWRFHVPVTIFEIKLWRDGCAYEIAIGYFDEAPNKIGEIPVRSWDTVFIPDLARVEATP